MKMVLLLQSKIVLLSALLVTGTTTTTTTTEETPKKINASEIVTSTTTTSSTTTIATTTTIKPNTNETLKKGELKQSPTNLDLAAQYELYPIQILAPQLQFDRNFPRIQPQVFVYGAGDQGQRPVLFNPPGNFLIPHGGGGSGGPNVILRNNPQTPLFPPANYPKPSYVPAIEKDAEEIPTNPSKIPLFQGKPSIHKHKPLKPEKLETFNESPNYSDEHDGHHNTRNNGDQPETVSLRPDQRFFFLNGKNLFDYPKESWPYSNHPQSVLKYGIDPSKSNLEQINDGNRFIYPNEAWLYRSPNDQENINYEKIGKIEEIHTNYPSSPSAFDAHNRTEFTYSQQEILPFLPQSNLPNVRFTKVHPFPLNSPEFLQSFGESSQGFLKNEENEIPSEITPAFNFMLYNRPLIIPHAEARPHLLSPHENNGVLRTAQSYGRKSFGSEPPSFRSFRQSKSDFVEPHVIGHFRYNAPNQNTNQYQDDIENDAVIIDASDDQPEASVLARVETNGKNTTEVKSNKTESVEKEPAEPSTAQAGPQATAIVGPGGVADAAPKATAIVGKGGVAVSSPHATAVAGTKEDEKKKKPAKKNNTSNTN